MKLNTLFVAAICAGTLLTSCVDKTARENQLKYTHTSLADGDAFASIQIIGEKALVGAEQAKTSSDANASKVGAFYNELIPSLDSVATALHMDFPIKGVPALASTTDSLATTDSTATVVGQLDFAHQAIEDVAAIKEQLKRMTRNTNETVQAFAKKYYPIASELFTQIGGKEEAGGHH